jgi:Tfp pilus assembly protein FimT
MMKSQRGLSLFGMLVIVALAGLALYYAYLGITGEDAAPNCRSISTECLKNCRRTRTEAPDLQRCQEACRSDAEECERRSQLLTRPV